MVEIMPYQVRDYAVGTLAAQVAATITTKTITDAFLAKHFRGTWVLMTPDANDILVVGLARGDTTVAEIKTAMEMSRLERDESNSIAAKQVLWETVKLLTETSGGFSPVNIDVTLGGGKGIPFDADDGYQMFVYNLGANDQVAGALIYFEGYLTGVWL